MTDKAIEWLRAQANDGYAGPDYRAIAASIIRRLEAADALHAAVIGPDYELINKAEEYAAARKEHADD